MQLVAKDSIDCHNIRRFWWIEWQWKGARWRWNDTKWSRRVRPNAIYMQREEINMSKNEKKWLIHCEHIHINIVRQWIHFIIRKEKDVKPVKNRSMSARWPTQIPLSCHLTSFLVLFAPYVYPLVLFVCNRCLVHARWYSALLVTIPLLYNIFFVCVSSSISLADHVQSSLVYAFVSVWVCLCRVPTCARSVSPFNIALDLLFKIQTCMDL